jgi:hypothetical protein
VRNSTHKSECLYQYHIKEVNDVWKLSIHSTALTGCTFGCLSSIPKNTSHSSSQIYTYNLNFSTNENNFYVHLHFMGKISGHNITISCQHLWMNGIQIIIQILHDAVSQFFPGLLESDAMSLGEWLLMSGRHYNPSKCQEPLPDNTESHPSKTWLVSNTAVRTSNLARYGITSTK